MYIVLNIIATLNSRHNEPCHFF